MAPPKVESKEPKTDGLRGLVENVVFVVVLVLLLKLYVVEAFVIPTGSMAETLYGDHKATTCEQCGFAFDVNANGEVETNPNRPHAPVVGYCCPNCRFTGKYPIVQDGSRYYTLQNRTPAWPDRLLSFVLGNSATSGDRLLVHKLMGPEDRGAIVVFKYPVTPQDNQIAQNYIKRCVGFGGETLAIWRGDLFVTRALPYTGPAADDPRDLWQKDYSQFPNAPATELFEKNRQAAFADAGGFQLYRKPDDLAMSMRRIVYDNDHQPADLNKVGYPARWSVGDSPGWAGNPPYAKSFKHTGAEFGTLAYRHYWASTKPETVGGETLFFRDIGDGGAFDPAKQKEKPKRITNVTGYNTPVVGPGFTTPYPMSAEPDEGNDYWVGDLMLECKADLANADSVVVLDLARGPHRYRAEFAGGTVKLTRTLMYGVDWVDRERKVVLLKEDRQKTDVIATKATGIGTGKYDLRFANVDCRLRVWVNGKSLELNEAGDYPYDLPEIPDEEDPHREGWVGENDKKEPATIHAKGEVEVSAIKLWRDTFYTGVNPRSATTWKPDFLYVQPGHYLCLGDNSTKSHDGRGWGLVPERLMLGRAVFTFFPFDRLGFIR